MAGLSKEELLQEALVGWVLAGGSCGGLIQQLDEFFDAVSECESFSDGGRHAIELDRLCDALDTVLWRANKVDRAGGFPELSPAEKAKGPQPLVAAPPIKVLVDIENGVLEHVRSSAPVDVSLWNRDEVREGLVPTALLNMPAQLVTVLDERGPEFPETKQAGGVLLYLCRVDGRVRLDRAGKPIYCTVPGSEA